MDSICYLISWACHRKCVHCYEDRFRPCVRDKYLYNGGADVVVQTTGDLVTEKIIDELLEHDAWMISIAGVDGFHVGHEGERRIGLQEKLVGWFEKAGMTQSGVAAQDRKWLQEPGPMYSLFGATPDAWIGNPIYEAMNGGHPERMGLAHGWDLDTYYAKFETATPKQQPYHNPCIGCDKFHEEVQAPEVKGIRDERGRTRMSAAAA